MRNLFIVIALLATSVLQAQMTINNQTLFGNEWIDYNKTYVKVGVDQDGMVMVTQAQLIQNGLIPSQLIGANLKMVSNGNEMPIYVSNDGTWGSNDYLLFYGERNDGFLDGPLFENAAEDQINPRVNMYSDTRYYFISIDQSGSHERFVARNNNVNGSTLAKEQFYMEKLSQVFEDDKWTTTSPDDVQLEFSSFLPMDGFSSRMSSDRTMDFDFDHYYEQGTEPEVYIRIGSNNSSHFIQLEFNGTPLLNDIFIGAQVKAYRENISKNNVRGDRTNFVRLRGTNSSDNQSVSIVDVRYPRTHTAGNNTQYLFYSGANNNDQRVEIPDFGSGTKPLVFDLDNHNVMVPVMNGNTANVILPGGSVSQARILLLTEEEYLQPLEITQTNFIRYENFNPSYLILTSNVLNTTENGRNVVEEYAEFRESDLGGSFEVSIVNAEDLYNQFGYGVANHPQAIRNFAHYVQDKWPNHELSVIIGKALTYFNKNANVVHENIVPTYGKPGSDNLLFASNDLPYPNVGIGRIAAQSQQQLSDYLDKVKLHAALRDVVNLPISERLWLKNMIHLSGGGSREQAQIFRDLGKMSDIVTENQFGADITTYRKTSSDPVTTAVSEEIINLIDTGIAMLTFFGHSSAATFDFSIEDPREYSNEGKNPIIFSMGCHSGDIHENTRSLSENFVLTPKLGAVGFIASSGNAYPDALAPLGEKLYDRIGNEFYGQPLGLALKDALIEEYNIIRELYDNSTMQATFDLTFDHIITLLEQNTFHGDPAVSFFALDGPDYVVDLPTVRTMDVVGTQSEFIELSFDVVNLGMGTDTDSLDNYITHTFGNGETQTIFFKSPAVKNRQNITVKIPNPGKTALGKNAINIVLDHNNQVREEPNPIGEDNNDLIRAWSLPTGFCFFIFDDSAQPIHPYDFGIVGDRNATLFASSSNALSDRTLYEIQLDTSELFDSPFLMNDEILSSSGVIRWNPNANYNQETVYYWRVKPKNAANAIWSPASSFVYVEGAASGWNQSHFYQWTKDEGRNVLIDTTSRDLVFTNTLFDIRLQNAVHPFANPEIVYQNVLSEFLRFGGEVTAGVYMASFDGDTGVARFNNVGGDHESHILSPWIEDYVAFPYWTDTKERRANVINFIENVVPTGDYIAMYTIQRTDIGGVNDYSPQDWEADGANGDPDLMSVLEKYGATQVRSLANDVKPYIFVFKKDDPSFTPIELKANSDTEIIETNVQITARWFEGQLESTPIGPAIAWDELLWNLEDLDLEQDTFRLDIIGIDEAGNETVVMSDVDEFVRDISNISADTYPYLKLRFHTFDETSRTSAQIPFWRVLYTEVPEAVLDLETKLVFESDTISRGRPFKFETVATNLTNVDMDSLYVDFTVTDQNNQIRTTTQVLDPLKAFESLDINFELPTDGLVGANQFRVEINPGPQQREKHLFNNLGLRSFFVEGDNTNPLLDVTFDGVRIFNGDLISPNPSIRVILKDENTFNPITDISNFDLALQRLPDNQPYPIDLSANDVVFFPADSTNNYCASIEFTPEFESGEYILFVQGTDMDGNLSGDRNLSIEFEVETASTITNVINYPNPFSTQTEFVFTLTGRTVPDEFTIQIYSMSGKVVKEIRKEELGPLRIGLNRTDYKWTGTDDFGNKLANGVYLYRIITSEVDGNTLDHRQTEGIDSFFKRGFGKLVIMR